MHSTSKLVPNAVHILREGMDKRRRVLEREKKKKTAPALKRHTLHTYVAKKMAWGMCTVMVCMYILLLRLQMESTTSQRSPVYTVDRQAHHP